MREPLPEAPSCREVQDPTPNHDTKTQQRASLSPLSAGTLPSGCRQIGGPKAHTRDAGYSIGPNAGNNTKEGRAGLPGHALSSPGLLNQNATWFAAWRIESHHPCLSVHAKQDGRPPHPLHLLHTQRRHARLTQLSASLQCHPLAPETRGRLQLSFFQSVCTRPSRRISVYVTPKNEGTRTPPVLATSANSSRVGEGKQKDGNLGSTEKLRGALTCKLFG